MEDMIAAKRASMLNRLEMAKLSEHLGKEPWTCIANSAYEACTNPSISVLITLYNYSEYIYQCLDSVCASKDAELPGGFEIIVVEDCSTDESASLVEQYLHQSPVPIRLVKKLFNTGLADARNTGLRIARSSYVFILDADNWIYPNCLSTLYSAIHETNYAAIYGIIRKFESETNEGLGLLSVYDWDVRELVEAPYIDAMALFKRETVVQLGGYSTELLAVGWSGWEDYDLWLKLAQAGYSCKQVPQILSSYRLHSQSMINTTGLYVPVLSRHFLKKFARLVDKHQELNKVFGYVDKKASESTVVMAKADAIAQPQQQVDVKQLRSKIKRLKQELEDSQERVNAMETSKFWKMRKAWFRVKRLMGSSELE